MFFFFCVKIIHFIQKIKNVVIYGDDADINIVKFVLVIKFHKYIR